MIEVAYFCTIGEKHSVSKPVEAVGQDDFAFGSRRCSIEVNAGGHFVSIAQIYLILVGIGKCVGLPKRHVSIIAGNHPPETNL